MDVSVTTLPDFHVAYIRNVGPYGSSQIPALWTKLFDWGEPLGIVTPERITLGISYDDPYVTPPEKCRYDACIVVPLDLEPDSTVKVKDVPGGEFAVSKYVGTAGDIMAAWKELLTVWLPSSGYRVDQRDAFEIYRGNAFVDQDKGIFQCDICVPVKPR